MKKYDYIFFDLDGTLTDPEHGLVASFAYGLGKMGITWSDKSELKRFIGPPLYTEWQEVYDFTPEESSRALDYFTEYYQVYGWWDNVVYDGVHEMLERLKNSGKRIILATSKPEHLRARFLTFLTWQSISTSLPAQSPTRSEIRSGKCFSTLSTP